MYLAGYTKTRAYIIDKGSVNLYEQVIFSWRQNMSKGVGELLFIIIIFLFYIYSEVELTLFFKQDDHWCIWNFGTLTILPYTWTFM
jgi:hypothetical protein